LIRINENVLFPRYAGASSRRALGSDATLRKEEKEAVMRLTTFSDYAIRVLILAASTPDRNVTVEDAARLYGISAAHLKKVVRALTRAKFLEGTRGRGGGFRLARPPEDIGLGDVIRQTEPDFALVECFRPDNACRITGICQLPPILRESIDAMLEVLDRHTLADIVIGPDQVAARLGISVPPPRQTDRPGPQA
jgi:Rrf2 family nitric oxide-sensitive transcriptional repressor